MTRRMIRLGVALITALALLIPPKPLGSASPPSSQLERLAGLANVWGAIKFFHPYVAEQNIDWDSALTQTIPKVESARNPEEYQQAIDYLLSFLHDPSTHTITRPASAPSKNPASASGPAQPSVRWTDDHVAIVVANDFAQFAGNFSKLAAIKKAFDEASKGKGIVFDLRSHRREVDGDSAWWFTSQFTQALPVLLDHIVVESSSRYRIFSGYPSEEGGSGSYYSAFVVQDGTTMKATGTAGSARPMAFLIDAGTPDLSALLGGLEASGQAIVVLEGALGDGFGCDRYLMDLPDGVKVAMRVDELMNPDGSVGFHPTISVPQSSGSAATDQVLDAALAAIREGFRPPRHSEQHMPSIVPSRPEEAYAQMTFPSKEYRLLALFRFWNIMRYFHAYQDLLDQPWEDTLTDFIPLFEANQNAQEYALTVAKMVARIQDSHGYVDSKVLLEYIGTARAPIDVRSIEGQTVVTRLLDDPAAKTSGLEIGDLILAVDGEETGARRKRLGEIFAASTPQALRWEVDRALLRGPADMPAKLHIKSAQGDVRDIVIHRLKDLPDTLPKTPIFRVLPEGFGYIDLTRLMPGQIDDAFDAVRDTPAVIFDMRGYPNGVFYLLGAHLTDKKVVAARIETPTPQIPDPTQESRVKFLQYAEPDDPSPNWKYKGKIVVLIDERAISQAEHTCLFLEAMTHAKFVGTPTSGANGDVTVAVLPGNVRVWFSGHDVRHSDGRQLQRLGIQPDIRVEPTIEAIRQGRDEVLDAAVDYLKRQR